MTKTAVIGLGTMGPGIAATLARGGMTVRVFDTSAAALERAPATIATANQVLERLGVPAKGSVDDISLHGRLEDAVRGAELVLETVPEKADIKEAVFRQIDAA